MANTINSQGRVVNLSAVDTDWNFTETFVGYTDVRLHSIKFIPAQAADKCVIKNKSDTGPIIFQATAATSSDEKIEYFDGVALQPYLDVSAGSYAAGAMVILIVK